MRTVGLTLGHSPSVCLFELHGGKQVIYGFDKLNEVTDLINEFGVDTIDYYELPWLKKTRQLWAGQWAEALDPTPRQIIRAAGLDHKIRYHGHHKTHAATALAFSQALSPAILVIDAIGEWDTVSIWQSAPLKKLHSQHYPFSLGLFYSAFTKMLGGRPNKDEAMIFELAQKNTKYLPELRRLVEQRLLVNNHKGIQKSWVFSNYTDVQIASAVQGAFIRYVKQMIELSSRITGQHDTLVITGGCALNAEIPNLVHHQRWFDQIEVCKRPTDYGSSVGAALLGMVALTK